jgi:transcriptional regulator with XRE-family HTH domain
MAVTEIELRKRVGLLLRAARLGRGWSRFDLAESADVSKDMIGRIERGGTGVRFPVLIKLSTALGIDPAELFAAPTSSGAASPLLNDIAARLAVLDQADLAQISSIIDASLRMSGRPLRR